MLHQETTFQWYGTAAQRQVNINVKVCVLSMEASVRMFKY